MELSASQLTQLKEIELEIFRSFIQLCGQLNLKYYVLGGTLLGAVRHQGFIPWDDDIDVGMPRKDYETLLALGQQYLPEGLFLQTFQTDPGYPANFAKLRNSHTTFVEYSLKDCSMNHGIYIDIFPLDYYPDAGQRLFEAKKLLMSLRITDAFSTSGMKPATKMVRWISRVLYPSVSGAVKKREALFTSVTHGEKIANHCGAWGKKEIMPAAWYGDGVLVPFEGMQVKAPSCYHEWLTQVYGNYMQLPPAEKRIPHHYVDAFETDIPYTHYLERNSHIL